MQYDALAGLRVLDLTRVVAGPYTTRFLGDFGAEVIKVQSKRTARGVESNPTSFFGAWNRNKRSITLNMDRTEARELFLGLVEVSDVVVENFAPRVMSNWNLDYTRLRSVNEKLIMLSMSGMGQSGPWKDYVAYGPTVQSLGGLTYLTSYSHDDPIGLGYAYADIISGMYGAVCVLGALQYRQQTGQGQYIDLSEYEAVCTAAGPALMDAFANQREILPTGNVDHDVPAAPYGCYRCLGVDRWCVVAVYDEDEWQAFCRVLGSPPWTEETRFSTLPNRQKHREELHSRVSQWMAHQSPDEAVEQLQKAGVRAGVVQNAEQLANDPQLVSNGFFDSIRHPVLGETIVDTYPINFSNHQKRPWKPAPLLGEANQYVFGEILGMTKAAIESYVRDGIIA